MGAGVQGGRADKGRLVGEDWGVLGSNGLGNGWMNALLQVKLLDIGQLLDDHSDDGGKNDVAVASGAEEAQGSAGQRIVERCPRCVVVQCTQAERKLAHVLQSRQTRDNFIHALSHAKEGNENRRLSDHIEAEVERAGFWCHFYFISLQEHAIGYKSRVSMQALIKNHHHDTKHC